MKVLGCVKVSWGYKDSWPVFIWLRCRVAAPREESGVFFPFQFLWESLGAGIDHWTFHRVHCRNCHRLALFWGTVWITDQILSSYRPVQIFGYMLPEMYPFHLCEHAISWRSPEFFVFKTSVNLISPLLFPDLVVGDFSVFSSPRTRRLVSIWKTNFVLSLTLCCDFYLLFRAGCNL